MNAYSGTSLKATPTLFFEFHGTPAGVAEQAETTGELAEAFGGEVRWHRGRDPSGREAGRSIIFHSILFYSIPFTRASPRSLDV